MLALGLADFLEDHLLGGLRRDASEHLGRLRELDLVADLHLDTFAIQRAGFVDRDFGCGVGDLFDDGLQREEVDLAGLGVEPRLQVFTGLVVLARRGRDGLLDGADDDVGLDALFLRQRFDRLLQRIRHV